MLVIPAINVHSFSEARAQYAKVAPFATWIHLDVVDGKFASNVTWGSPEELKLLISNSQFPIPNVEIHLMAKNPEFLVPAWLEAGARRVIVHVEAIGDEETITDQCRERHADAMLAATPETPVERLLEYAGEFSMFQVLAVPPGRAGEKFDPRALEKIKMLRTKALNATIEVDGGIDPETAKRCRDAGANIVASASYLFGSADPKIRYEELARV